ncbi:MAG: ABC transporter permease DevC [Cyanobacteria bacterium P01_A01_bin.17]
MKPKRRFSLPFKLASSRVNLAWAQLTHQKVKLVIAITGVGFANILMFTQLGLRAVLFDGITLIHEQLEGELFMISTYTRALGRSTFPRVYLYQANAVAGVRSARPLYIAEANWVSPEKIGKSTTDPADDSVFPDEVKILAFNPAQPVFKLPGVNQQLNRLSEPDTVLFDRLSQPSLGPISEQLTQQDQVRTVMDQRRVSVIGDFQLGSTLFTKGHVIMSDWNYAQRYGQDRLRDVSLGLLVLAPGSDPTQVQQQLKANLPASVSVFTREELIVKEKTHWESDPSGIVLNFGAFMGFIVGVIVVYQVLYTDVAEHLPEYATLKAMGYADRALLMVVLQEAVLLAILGFIPGTAASVGVYSLLSYLTKIPLVLRPDVMLQVFLLTFLMCSSAGAIAVRKLKKADPADIF